MLTNEDIESTARFRQLSREPDTPEPGHNRLTLDDAAFYGLPGDLARAVDPYTEADPVAVLTGVLAGFGNCVGSGVHTKVGSTKHCARLFVVHTGDTSAGRKGTAWSLVGEVLAGAEKDWSAHCLQHGGLSSAEGLIYRVRDLTEGLNRKGERVITDEGVADKRLFVVEDEFASVLTVISREGNNLSPVLRAAWDRGDLATMTRNNPLKSTAAHIAIIGHITKAEILARLDETSKGNGFANRFLFIHVKRSKELPDGPIIPDEVLAPLIERVRRAVVFAKTTGLVVRDAEATTLWREVYHKLSTGRPGLLGAVLGRAEAQVLRLSLLYALLDCSEQIRFEHLEAALDLWEYSEQSAVQIFGDSLGDPIADKIRQALRDKPLSDEEIYHLFHGHADKTKLQTAKKLLVEYGLADSYEETTAGRARTMWQLTM